jgi:BolA protein
MGEIAREIEQRLGAHFQPSDLLVRDDSARHAGHAGHNGQGESHFFVRIESAAFAGLGRVARQRAVNAVLADLLASRVHALALQCRAPGEAHG